MRFGVPAVLVAVLVAAAAAGASVALTQVAADPFTNAKSAHRTAVEPDTFANGSTLVAASQLGRFPDGGSSDIGFSTTTDGGGSWTNGALPGTTKQSTPAGPYDRVSDPSVAYDERDGVWLIASLAIRQKSSSVKGAAVLVSRSTDGGLTWSSPTAVVKASGQSDLDKDWIVCDDTSSSPFYGSCYVEYDDFGLGNPIHVAYSRNGGLSWTDRALSFNGIGGQPVVQPSGTVIMPTDNKTGTKLLSVRSTNGGVTWSFPATIAKISFHTEAGDLRSDPLPSAEIDGDGRVYVVWPDCRFRLSCSANDIVLSSSADGVTWSAPARIPVDAVSSGVDHFIAGIGVDPSTSGGSAELGLTYYYYPVSRCSASSCQLDVGYVSSSTGGATWSAPTQLAGPMQLPWLAPTTHGRMVGDYVSTSFAGGSALTVIAVANAPSAGGDDCASATPSCDEAMYAPAAGLAPVGAGSKRPLDTSSPVVSSGAAARAPLAIR